MAATWMKNSVRSFQICCSGQKSISGMAISIFCLNTRVIRIEWLPYTDLHGSYLESEGQQGKPYAYSGDCPNGDLSWGEEMENKSHVQ